VSTDLEESHEYVSTIEQLEKLKKVGEQGLEFWMARDIHATLGYAVWDKFEPVISRATDSLRTNGLEPSHHIAQTSKMMGLGKGGLREGVDYFLSRPACRLIAMNGDPTKAEIAAAQAYFVVQTHRMEVADQLADDVKRLELRDKVTRAHKRVSAVAKGAGVRNQMQGVFHDAGSRGLYGLSRADVKRSKGLQATDNLYDHADALELSANDFQMNLAADVIGREGIKREQAAIDRNLSVGKEVRLAMKNSGARLPENLPLASEPIKTVQKRVSLAQKAQGVTSSTEPERPAALSPDDPKG